MTGHVLDLLICLTCGTPFGPGAAADGEALTCAGCGTRVPVRNGIPRFVRTPDSEEARRTQASFGYEWTHFADWEPSGAVNFNDYFAGVDLAALREAVVLDAGCGMGRHARQMAPHAGTVIAVDFSAAIEQAARNTASAGTVTCVQADLTTLPLRDEAVDFVYSLGVLHHIADTHRTLAGLVAKLKPGGRIRVYLYWKRTGAAGLIVVLVSAVRLITTRLPFTVVRALSWLLSLALFAVVVLPYKALSAAGGRGMETWPLFVYSKYPFTVLYNDQFDRFSAPLEKRYTREEVRDLLLSVGLVDVSVRPCFGWLGDAVKPAGPAAS